MTGYWRKGVQYQGPMKKRGRPKGSKKVAKKSAPKANKIIAGQLHVYNKRPHQLFRTLKTVYSAVTITGANLSVGAVRNETVSTVADWSNIATLFNRYKLNKVKYTFTLIDTGATNFTNTRMPEISLRYNYDSNLTSGGVAPSLIQQMNNINTFQMTPDRTRIEYTIHPHTIGPVYLSAVSSAYKLNPKLYIDSTYNTVPHYGLLYYIDYLATGFTMQIDIEYDLSLKYAV